MGDSKLPVLVTVDPSDPPDPRDRIVPVGLAPVPPVTVLVQEPADDLLRRLEPDGCNDAPGSGQSSVSSSKAYGSFFCTVIQNSENEKMVNKNY